MVDGAMLRMGRASISAPICLADGHSADPRARACLGTSGSLLLAPSGYLASSGLQVPVQTRLWEAVVRWHLGWSLAHSAALLSASHILCPALQLAVGDEQTPTSSICLYHLRTRVTLLDHPGHQWFQPTQGVLEGRLRLGLFPWSHLGNRERAPPHLVLVLLLQFS